MVKLSAWSVTLALPLLKSKCLSLLTHRRRTVLRRLLFIHSSTKNDVNESGRGGSMCTDCGESNLCVEPWTLETGPHRPRGAEPERPEGTGQLVACFLLY